MREREYMLRRTACGLDFQGPPTRLVSGGETPQNLKSSYHSSVVQGSRIDEKRENISLLIENLTT